MRERFIRSRRKALRLGVPDIAQVVGVSETAVWRWDAGQSQPRPSHHQALADCLRVTKEELQSKLQFTQHLKREADTAIEVLDRARIRLAEINGLSPEDIVLEMRILSKGNINSVRAGFESPSGERG